MASLTDLANLAICHAQDKKGLNDDLHIKVFLEMYEHLENRSHHALKHIRYDAIKYLTKCAPGSANSYALHVMIRKIGIYLLGPNIRNKCEICGKRLTLDNFTKIHDNVSAVPKYNKECHACLSLLSSTLLRRRHDAKAPAARD